MLPKSRAEQRKWGRLLSEIETLKRLCVKYRVPMPDLTCERRGVPASDVIAVRGHCTPARSRPAGAKQFAVGHSHKQGLEMLTPNMVKHDLPYLGGKKT